MTTGDPIQAPPQGVGKPKKNKHSRRTFLLTSAAFLAFIMIGISGLCIHAGSSAMRRATAYDKFDKYVLARKQWTTNGWLSIALSVGFASAAGASLRDDRRKRGLKPA